MLASHVSGGLNSGPHVGKYIFYWLSYLPALTSQILFAKINVIHNTKSGTLFIDLLHKLKAGNLIIQRGKWIFWLYIEAD